MEPMAVIDIGTSAIRMTIADVSDNGSFRQIETLQQAVSLGKDTFTKGIISKSNIEESIRALKSFRRILDEYKISQDRLRIVTTTAVREAINRETFTDRVYIATGLDVEILDDVDIARITYLSLRNYIETLNIETESNVLVTEIGGGNTELIHIYNGDVVLAKNYRLGSLRLRESLETFRTPLPRRRELMESDINRTIDQILYSLKINGNTSLFILGGDARFAANFYKHDWNFHDQIKIPVSSLNKITNEMLALTVDDIVHKHHLFFSDAETVGPALLYYHNLARAINVKNVIVADISMRHGLLLEMTHPGSWIEQFSEQMIQSAIEIGRKYNFDEAHARHVMYLCSTIFNSLKSEHRLEPRFELFLKLAALLHEIGKFVSFRSHHKHSMYLIQNSDLFGPNRKDILLISLIARYHRGSAPKPLHDFYKDLDRDRRLIISKLASILRIADSLDRSYSQRIRDIECKIIDNSLLISIANIYDISLEQLGIQTKGAMFEDVYGMKINLQLQVPATE